MLNLFIVILMFFSQLFSIKSQEKSQRIVRGYEAEMGQFPFYVFLRITESDRSKASCGATIISDQWLVTAAHCIHGSESLVAYFDNLTIKVEKNDFHVHTWWFKILGWNDIG